MDSIFFSVIIPTFNRANLLCKAIQSVIDQKYKNLELIVIDDHSLDNTREVVSSFHDKRIKYILNDHCKGGAGARNAGIIKAQGEWVAFLDDDDLWLPHKLTSLYEKIREVDDSVGLIYTGFAIYDFQKNQEIAEQIPEKEGWIQNDLLYKNYIGTFSVVSIRNTLLREVGGLDERFEAMQDLELYVRIASRKKIALIGEKLTYTRNDNLDRITLNRQKKLNSCLLFHDKYHVLIAGSKKLQHRSASRIFLHAAKARNKYLVFKALPWTLAGFFYDFINLKWTFRNVLFYYYSAVMRKIVK